MTVSEKAVQDLVLDAFAENVRRKKPVMRFAAMVQELCNEAPLQFRLEALVRLVNWARAFDAKFPPTIGLEKETVSSQWRRVAALVSVLETQQGVRTALVTAFAAIFAQTDAVHVMAETGLPTDRGFIAETSERIFRRVLPTPRDDRDLAKLLLRLFPTKPDAVRLQSLPAELFERLAQVLCSPDVPDAWHPIRDAMVQAFCLLGSRLAALGLTEKLRARSRPISVEESPFFNLPRLGDEVLRAHRNGDDTIGPEQKWRQCADDCRAELQYVEKRLETAGVSIDVVFSMDLIQRGLRRMEGLILAITSPVGTEGTVAARRLLALLVAGRLSDRSLLDLGRSNLNLLARKIVERASETGEHYITNTPREYWGLVRAAIGGGLVTVFTAALKMKIGEAHLPPFPTGVLSSLNYAGSFILMQTLGFALATKQPAMTAASLAVIIGEAHKDGWGQHQLERLSSHTARIVRSQLAAAMGNVGAVLVGGVGFTLAWHRLLGEHFVSEEKALSSVASLNPIATGTIFYAALTGVILWLSSLAGGWIDNWSVYRRLPQAIAEHRFGAVLGPARMASWAAYFQHNISGWATSIALGVMLAFTPEFGSRFFGVPLDVRHVTLSTGTLAMGAITIGPSIARHLVILAACGIACIFVMNLSVSFGMALLLALRARNVGIRESVRVMFRIFFRFLRRPWEFLLPPGRAAGRRSS